MEDTKIIEKTGSDIHFTEQTWRLSHLAIRALDTYPTKILLVRLTECSTGCPWLLFTVYYLMTIMGGQHHARRQYTYHRIFLSCVSMCSLLSSPLGYIQILAQHSPHPPSSTVAAPAPTTDHRILAFECRPCCSLP